MLAFLGLCVLVHRASRSVLGFPSLIDFVERSLAAVGTDSLSEVSLLAEQQIEVFG